MSLKLFWSPQHDILEEEKKLDMTIFVQKLSTFGLSDQS